MSEDCNSIGCTRTTGSYMAPNKRKPLAPQGRWYDNDNMIAVCNGIPRESQRYISLPEANVIRQDESAPTLHGCSCVCNGHLLKWFQPETRFRVHTHAPMQVRSMSSTTGNTSCAAFHNPSNRT